MKALYPEHNLVVYLGHGNGWPSTMGPFRPEGKDGLGLQLLRRHLRREQPHEVLREQFIRDLEVKLAPNAVVFLHRLCYASGNAESGMAPVFDKDSPQRCAQHFASGFLDAGAGVVFARLAAMNLPQLLAESDETMDEIFHDEGHLAQWYDGFIGADDYYRDSTRTPGALVHLDPHPRFGTLRAITGNLDLTADEWRGDPRRRAAHAARPGCRDGRRRRRCRRPHRVHAQRRQGVRPGGHRSGPLRARVDRHRGSGTPPATSSGT
ncbi:MAG: hypothetical protein U0869_02100 [Chloroflexota bacterium]